MTHINVANLKQWHLIAGLLPPALAVCLRSTKKYHSGTGWLPTNICVSHTLSPICTPYLHDIAQQTLPNFSCHQSQTLSSGSIKSYPIIRARSQCLNGECVILYDRCRSRCCWVDVRSMPLSMMLHWRHCQCFFVNTTTFFLLHWSTGQLCRVYAVANNAAL